MRTVALIVLLALCLAVRAPWVFGEVSDTERAHTGAARQFVIQREHTPPPLRLDPPAASHVGSPVLWSLRSPAPEFDEKGPADQIGWLALRDTTLPTGDAVAPWVVLALVRLPFLLFQLVGVFLVFRLGERFYGTAAGVVAAALTGLAATSAIVGATATPAALVLPTIALFIAAIDDFTHAVGYDGSPPPWLLRKRTLALGTACGLALATTFAFVPIVIVGVIWLAGRRGAIERRGERCQPPAFFRRVLGVVVVAVIVWGVYVGDVAPYVEADLTLPAPLWWAGIADAVRDAAAIPWAERQAAARELIDPTLGALLVTGLIGWWFVRRDLTDTPALLLTMGVAALVTAAIVAPRHVDGALVAALPPFALLAGAWLVRCARHMRVAAAAVAALLLVGLAAGWHDAAPWSSEPPAAGVDAPSVPTSDEAWLLDRWIRSREPRRVITCLGREPMLRATATTRIEEQPPDDARIKSLLAAIDGGDDAAFAIGDWVREGTSLPSLTDREPDARFLRIAVYGRR